MKITCVNIELSHFLLIFYNVSQMLYHLFEVHVRVKVGTLKRLALNPLHLFTPVLSQEPDVQHVQWLSFLDVVYKCFSFLLCSRSIIQDGRQWGT